MTHRIAVIAGDGVGPEVVARGAEGGRRARASTIEWSELDWGSDH